MKFSLEKRSGHVNIHSGRDRIFYSFPPGISIHIVSESLFTSLRNDYSHAPESARNKKARRILLAGADGLAAKSRDLTARTPRNRRGDCDRHTHASRLGS